MSMVELYKTKISLMMFELVEALNGLLNYFDFWICNCF